jgi:hypothetical protein
MRRGGGGGEWERAAEGGGGGGAQSGGDSLMATGGVGGGPRTPHDAPRVNRCARCGYRSNGGQGPPPAGRTGRQRLRARAARPCHARAGRPVPCACRSAHAGRPVCRARAGRRVPVGPCHARAGRPVPCACRSARAMRVPVGPWKPGGGAGVADGGGRPAETPRGEARRRAEGCRHLALSKEGGDGDAGRRCGRGAGRAPEAAAARPWVCWPFRARRGASGSRERRTMGSRMVRAWASP